MSKVVLITGCSTGIGRDLAQRLTQAGNIVGYSLARFCLGFCAQADIQD